VAIVNAKYSRKNNKISAKPVFFITANHTRVITSSARNFEETDIKV
jgi:hypothetical protein